MRTLTFVMVFYVMSVSQSATAANPTHTLRPDKPDQLKKARIKVSYTLVVNDPSNPEYAFTITCKVPKEFDALDAFFSIRNTKGLVAMQMWQDTRGTCTAAFTVGKQSLKHAGFMTQLYIGQRTNAFSASGCYALSLN